MNAVDTCFVLISAALVMLMTPGLAFFYGGLVRSKNVLGTVMQSFIALGVISIVWVVYGYSLSFGTDIGGFIGGGDFLFLNGVGPDPHESIATNLSHLSFMIFQCMFAVITPALISGAFAERMRFSAYLLFIILWSTLVYAPLAHWVWGGGWMMKMGALDFAGGAVVHMSSGAAALACAIFLGKRKGYGETPFIPHNLPMCILGASLLWFGWFGFNAGSALAANGLAANAFVTTHLAAAAASVAWIVVEWMVHGKPTTLGAVSGAVAGLVVITPAAGFVTPMSALIMGLAGGAVCFSGVMLKSKLGYDDSLDVVGIHGLGGAFGALCTGLFCTKTVNEAGADGLFYGNAGQVVTQLISIGATLAFSFIMTMIILYVVNMITKVRASEEEEYQGLDHSQHSESGYQA